VRFREALSADFDRRRAHNSRYSLRGFARALSVHHASLSRLLNGTQPVQARTILALGPRLGLSSSQLAAMVAREDAAAVIAGIGRPSFRPDSRWLATRAGIPVDRVNIAIEALIRGGRLRMVSTREWHVSQ
jgi:plasmid maintenance system antidote protein VapI